MEATCAAFTPCGGDVEGTWDYAEGCVTDPFNEVRATCPSATLENLTVKGQGFVTLNAGEAARNLTLSGSGVLNVPAACVSGTTCNSIAATLSATGATATCADADGGCRCDASLKKVIKESTTYTLSGNTLVTNGRTYEYCVSGSTLQHRETGSSPTEPGTYKLTRR